MSKIFVLKSLLSINLSKLKLQGQKPTYIKVKTTIFFIVFIIFMLFKLQTISKYSVNFFNMLYIRTIKDVSMLGS